MALLDPLCSVMKFGINLSVSTDKASLSVDWDDLESTSQLGLDLFKRSLPVIRVLTWSIRIQSTNTEIFRTIHFYADLNTLRHNPFLVPWPEKSTTVVNEHQLKPLGGQFAFLRISRLDFFSILEGFHLTIFIDFY